MNGFEVDNSEDESEEELDKDTEVEPNSTNHENGVLETTENPSENVVSEERIQTNL